MRCLTPILCAPLSLMFVAGVFVNSFEALLVYPEIEKIAIDMVWVSRVPKFHNQVLSFSLETTKQLTSPSQRLVYEAAVEVFMSN